MALRPMVPTESDPLAEKFDDLNSSINWDTVSAPTFGTLNQIGGGGALSASERAAAVQSAAADRALAETTRRYEEGKSYNAPYYNPHDFTTLGNMVRGGEFNVEPFSYQEEQFADPTFNFEADPGYQFRKREGLGAINSNASKAGSLLSGSTLKALTKYGQDFASNEYQNDYGRFKGNRDYLRSKYETDRSFGYGKASDIYNSRVSEKGRQYNRLGYLAQTGMDTTTRLSNLATGQGSSISNIYGQQANAQAAGIMGKAKEENDWIDNLLEGLGILAPIAKIFFGDTHD